MYNKSTLRAIDSIIDDLAKRGALESDEHSDLKKAVRDLRHAIDIKKIFLIKKAVSKIAELLLRGPGHQP
jgi:hypothetical protein